MSNNKDDRPRRKRAAEHNAKIGSANKANGVGITPTKVCPRCKQTLPRAVFGKRWGSSKEYSASYCPPCTREDSAARARKHWAAHPEHAERRAAQNRVITLRRNYGISVEDYDALFVAQGGVCKICGAKPAKSGKKKNLPVDHCHLTGQIRGLLCEACNRGIGLLRDDPALLRVAIAYLETKPTLAVNSTLTVPRPRCWCGELVAPRRSGRGRYPEQCVLHRGECGHARAVGVEVET